MRNKITIKKSVKIVNEDGNNCYVIKDKRNSLDNTYNYLLSRSFDYFPDVIESGDKYYKYKYIEDTIEPREQKITDMVNLVTLLHSKTTFYKEVDIDNYKYIYESISNQIKDLYVYYEELITNIESNIYMSPSNYLIARNITIIFSMLNYAKDNLDKWYDKIKDKRKLRVVNIHNNLSLDHYLRSDKPYLVSWDNSRIDMPIYDLVNLYHNHYLDFDFSSIFKQYLSKYPLTEEETVLFHTLISIPNKIEYSVSEYKTVINIRKLLDYIYKTSNLLKEYSVEKQTDK